MVERRREVAAADARSVRRTYEERITVKIVVSALSQPHALSRREIEALFATLPFDLTADPAEFDLETGPLHENQFEYVESQRRARLAFVLPEKTAATTTLG